MKRIWVILVSVSLVGCAASEKKISMGSTTDVRKHPLTKIERLKAGMSLDEVLRIMGEQVSIGYRQENPDSGLFETIPLRNPHRVETLKESGNEYQVVYYYTSVQRPDGMISEDELTPLVFQDKKLIGTGQDFLSQVTRQN